MTPEDQEYYEDYLGLFTTKGWKQFQTEIQEIFDSHRIEDLKDVKDQDAEEEEERLDLGGCPFEDGIKANYEINLEKLDA